MLTKQQVKKILEEGLTAFQEVMDGKVFYQGQPVTPELGNWGGKGPKGCTVCIAGARYLKKNKTTIHEAIAEYQRETKISRLYAMQRVVGEAEVLLDAMRLPYLSDGASACLSGGMKVPGLFRELGINVPPCDVRTGYLDERQVLDRVRAILLLMEEEETQSVEVLTK